jgi:hypothetical protein
VGIIESIFIGVIVALIAAECQDWLPHITAFVIRTAVRLLPTDSRDRYYEEWLAEAAYVPGKISRLIWALGLIRASFSMRNLKPWQRAYDIAIASVTLVFLSPLACFLSLWIARTGPVFYHVTLLGRGGRKIYCLKFRTMVPNADAVLARYLDKHPEERKQWQRGRKLKRDPRFTPVGAWLRRTSLDEFPQLINVIRGDMSLIEPRIYVHEELPDRPSSLRTLLRLWRRRMRRLW